MPAPTYFDQFAEDLAHKVHALGTDTLKIMLTNTLPVLGNAVKTDITEIAAGDGYTAGGAVLTITSSGQTSGLYKLVLADTTWTATAGTFASFRYAVLYNDTPTSPVKPLICWWDYGSVVRLRAGESFVWDADPTTGVVQVQAV